MCKTKKAHTKPKEEKLYLNYDDTYSLNMYYEKFNLKTLLQNIFDDTTNPLLTLTFYKLTQQDAMQRTQT